MRNLEQLHERANGAVLSHQNLHRPNKCQKRPTIGAKETYYVAPLSPPLSLVYLSLSLPLCRF